MLVVLEVKGFSLTISVRITAQSQSPRASMFEILILCIIHSCTTVLTCESSEQTSMRPRGWCVPFAILLLFHRPLSAQSRTLFIKLGSKLVLQNSEVQIPFRINTKTYLHACMHFKIIFILLLLLFH